MAFSWKGLVSIILIVLPSLLYFVLEHEEVVRSKENKCRCFGILERVSGMFYTGTIIFIAPSRPRLVRCPLVIGCVMCLALYYGLWVRYFVKGRKAALLVDSVAGIPLPMALCLCIYLGFTAICLRNSIALFLALLFAIGHIMNIKCE